MTEVSQNGWTVLEASSTKWWNVPGTDRRLQLRRGGAGFALVHFATWFNREIEPLSPTFDDWGWSPRRIAGSDEWSNHASGTAADCNADAHPQGQVGTFTTTQAARIQHRLETRFQNLIRWGGTYRSVKDEMHFEIVGTPTQIAELYAVLLDTPIGQQITAIN